MKGNNIAKITAIAIGAVAWSLYACGVVWFVTADGHTTALKALALIGLMLTVLATNKARYDYHLYRESTANPVLYLKWLEQRLQE